VCALAIGFGLLFAGPAAAQEMVLVLHPPDDDRVAAIRSLGTSNGFTVDETAEPADLENLAGNRAVVFPDTGGDRVQVLQRDLTLRR
jgi:hypothetical protein